MTFPRTRPDRTLFAALAVLLIAGVAATAAIGAGGQSAGTQTPELPIDPPTVGAQAWIVYDESADRPLGSLDASTPHALASLTKLMTAIVVVEHTDPTDKVTVTKDALVDPAGSGSGIAARQTYTVDALLDTMLVHSANDAALALAIDVAGSEAKFVDMMNQRGKEIGLSHTHFGTATGLDDTYRSTAPPTEIITLARLAMKSQRIRRAVAMPSYALGTISGTQIDTFPNRNPLIGSYPGVDGVKTGHTLRAGYNLLVHYNGRSANQGMYVLVMGEQSEDRRTADTRALLDWAIELHPTMSFAAGGDVIGDAPVAWSGKRERLYVSNDLKVPILVGSHVSTRIIVPHVLRSPLRAGQEVGRYQVLVDGEVAASSGVFIKHDVKRISRLDRVRDLVSQYDRAWTLGVRDIRQRIGMEG